MTLLCFRLKKRALELRDANAAQQLLAKERQKVEQFAIPPRTYQSPKKLPPPPPQNQFPEQHVNPRRHAALMPLPNIEPSRDEIYIEPYKSDLDLPEGISRLNVNADIGVQIDEVIERQIQEEKDARLARQLQEQENKREPTQLDRDRMLAIEAQDKELAKMLQERERAKVKRAKERAKQKALVKKQQQQQQQQQVQNYSNNLMSDDSYSYPADLLPKSSTNVPNLLPNRNEIQEQYEDDCSYSFPVDVLQRQDMKRYIPQTDFDQIKPSSDVKILNSSVPNENNQPLTSIANIDVPVPVRPTQLDLK